MFEIVVERYNSSFVRIKAIYEVLVHICEYFTFKPNNYQFHPAYRADKWDGKIRLFNLQKNLFPIGLLTNLDYFIKQNPKWCVSYTKFTKSKSIFTYEQIEKIIEPYNRMSGRDYQIEGIRIALKERNCILLSPTATGKSFIIYNLANLFQTKGMKTLVIVPSIHLVTQLVGDFDDYSSECEKPFSDYCHKIFGGQEKHTFKDVTVSTYQSLINLPPDYFKQFKALIVDECHTGSTDGKVIKRLVELCNQTTYKIGLSGTLNDEKLDEFSVTGMYGQIYKLTTVKKEVARGNLSPFSIQRINLRYPTKSRKLFQDTFKEFKDDIENQKSINPLMKAGAKLYNFELDFVNNQPYKYKLINSIANKCKGNTLILFKRNESMGFKLHNFISKHTEKTVHLVYGKTPIEIREEVRAILERSENNIILANYQCFSTGISIKRLHNIILAESIKSKITLFQTIGRGLRTHTTKEMMKVFDICDDLSDIGFINYHVEHFNERKKLYDKEGYESVLWQKII